MDPSVLEFLQLKQNIHKIGLDLTVSVEEVKNLRRDLIRMKNEGTIQYNYCEKIVNIFNINLCNEQTSEDHMIAILECLETIIALSERVSDWDSYLGVTFLNCLTLISSPSNGCSVNDCSDELKESVVKLMKIIVQQSMLSEKCSEEIYRQSFAPTLGHAVFVLLALAEKEKSRNLRILVFEVLQSFTRFRGERTLLANRFGTFLPGISIACTRVIGGDTKQGQAVTVAALKTWQTFVTKTLDDSLYPESASEEPNEVWEKMQFPEVKRTEKWREDTASKLNILVREIVKLVTHGNWKVRLALIEWAEALLFTCFRSLNDSLNLILEAVITLLCDEYENISKSSDNLIQRFSSFYSSSKNQSLRDKLSEDMHILATRLPRIMRTSDDVQKQSTLNLLLGYLQLLGPQINHLLQSLPHQERLMLALLQITEMDTTELHILRQQTSNTANISRSSMPACIVTKWPQKTFKHFRESKIFDSIMLICKLLGHYGDISILSDCLLAKAQASRLYSKQAILILNQILLGAKEITTDLVGCDQKSLPQEEIDDLIRYTIDVYLSPDLWDVKTDVSGTCDTNSSASLSLVAFESPQQSDIVTGEKIRSNVLQKCFILEGLAYMSQVLGTKFQPHLMDLLYPVLEQVGSTSSLMAQTAELALQVIAHSCGHSTVSQLIASNSDYLVNSLSLKLCHYVGNEDAAVVLGVILQLCAASDILFLVQDALHQIFYVFDRHQNQNISPLLKVLHSLLLAIREQSKSLKHHETESTVKQTSKVEECSVLTRFLLEYHASQELTEDLDLYAENFLRDDDAQDEEIGSELDSNSDFMPDKKPEPPLEISTTLKVLERCIHMQSSPERSTRILVLEIMTLGIDVLRNSEDELLPIVHKLWSPFIQRFSDDEPVVMMKAIDALMVMADCCGEFIQKRTRESILPKILRFIEKQSKISSGKGSHSPYIFTFGYKLQLKLLSVMGLLAEKLQFQESHIESLCFSTFPYLASNQPEALQQAALLIYKCLVKLDEDLVWFFLRNLSTTKCTFSPSVPLLRTISFGRDDVATLPVNGNVDKLLQEM